MARVSPEEFVTAWTRSGSVAEVAARTGLTRSGAANRAHYYRRQGVVLKAMPAGRPRKNTDGN